MNNKQNAPKRMMGPGMGGIEKPRILKMLLAQ